MRTPLAPRHVAIVGCGFAGTSALWQLIDRHPVAQITVFERSGRFGPGLPYQTDENPAYLINNTTDTMCLAPGNRRAFIAWLRSTGHPGADAPKGHLPRAEFGRFLQAVLQAALANAAVKGIQVDLLPHEVSGLSESADGVRLSHAGGQLLADAVLLTTGRCPDVDMLPAPPHGPPDGTAACGLASHIHNAALDSLPEDAQVIVLGASLSAYDIVNRLFAPDTGARFTRAADGQLCFEPGPNRRQVVLGSRSGRLKRMQSQRPGRIHRTRLLAETLQQQAQSPQGLTLAAIAGLIEEEARLHRAVIDWADWRDRYAGCDSAAAVNARAGERLARDIAAAQAGGAANFEVELAADAQLLVWDCFGQRLLQPDDEARYRRQFETAVLSCAAPCPVPTAERLLALHRAGRLQVRQGAGAPTRSADGTHWRLPHRFGIDQARFLVNASGSVNRRLDAAGQDALYAQASAQGLLKPYRLNGEPGPGIAVDMRSYRAEGSQRIHLANMFLWGPGFFTSSAFLMATVVERALDAMFSGPAAAG